MRKSLLICLFFILVLTPFSLAQLEGEKAVGFPIIYFGIILLIILVLGFIIYLFYRKTIYYWFKGGLTIGLSFIFILILYGFVSALTNGGSCSFGHTSSSSIMNCFFSPLIIGIYGIIPVIVLGIIIGYIYGRSKKIS